MAWAGREKQHEEELNPGSFAIVQLYHIRDFGRPGAIHTYREGWELTVKPKEVGDPEYEPIYRGPIFNRWGGLSRDYDPLFRFPVFVCTVDENYSHKDGTPMNIADVFTGSFLETIRYWLIPIQRRIREHNREMGRDLNSKAEDVAHEMSSFLWREANKPDAEYKPVAYKHAKDELRSLDKLQQRGESLERYYDV